MNKFYIFLVSLFLFGGLTSYASVGVQDEKKGDLFLASEEIEIRYSDRSRSIEVFVLTEENDQPLEVILFDALGNRVYQHQWSPGTYGKSVTGSLDELNTGVFFVRVFYGNKVFTTGITIGAGGV